MRERQRKFEFVANLGRITTPHERKVGRCSTGSGREEAERRHFGQDGGCPCVYGVAFVVADFSGIFPWMVQDRDDVVYIT